MERESAGTAVGLGIGHPGWRRRWAGARAWAAQLVAGGDLQVQKDKQLGVVVDQFCAGPFI